jgi:hypothetical protein
MENNELQGLINLYSLSNWETSLSKDNTIGGFVKNR